MFTIDTKIKIPFTGLNKSKSSNNIYNNDTKVCSFKNDLKEDLISFSAKTDKAKKVNVESTVKSVKDKNYQGYNLFDSDGHIFWDKIGYEKLDKEPLDFSKPISEAQRLAYYHALSIGENKEDPRVTKYNPTNVDAPLAVPHFLFSPSAKEYLVDNINKLNAIVNSPEAPAFLKQELINQKTGRLNLRDRKSVV